MIIITVFGYIFSSIFSSSSNYTLRSMPLPVVDVSRVVGKEGSMEEALKKIQALICRNHSDERLGIELVAHHQERLFTSAQQSVSSTPAANID